MTTAMRALLVLIALAGLARADGPAGPRTKPTGFSHAVHLADVAKANAAPIACARCHVVKAGLIVGKPNHASCFGECHPPAPKPSDPPPGADRVALCNPCHAETALAAPKPPVFYPPFSLGVEFAPQVDHRAHAAIACDRCHPIDRAARPPVPHKRCLGCHDGTKQFAMVDCEKCHVPATERDHLAPAVIVVRSAFSHPKHATRGAARQCGACHAAVVATEGRELPRPTAQSCSGTGCHDLATACTKCHRDRPESAASFRPTTRFSHTQHDKAQLACAACHPFGKAGELVVAGHAACTQCHADDFGKREPKICGACHDSAEPWRPLVADRLPPDYTEFGATLAHDKHPQPCTSCHSLTTPTVELRPARGHAACATKGCHARKAGPEPHLDACEGCHQHAVAETRRATRLAASWSVRARFQHAPHQQDKDGTPLACIACHTDLRSPTVLSLATPQKPTCARCHDGATAFKLTGTSCTRCHLGEQRQR